MWGVAAAMAFVLAGTWLALAQAVLIYAHPYGAQPAVLDTLYAGYIFSVVSACVGLVMLWRYWSMRRRYSELFRIANTLR